MHDFLQSLGLSLTSSLVYDLLKSALHIPVTREQLVERIASQLNITNASIVADRIIDFAAQNGDIIISQT
jgi:ribulose kinase